MFAGLTGYGLCYLGLQVLLAQWLDDQFTLLFINIFVVTFMYLIFGSQGMTLLCESPPGNYFYFGSNYVLP